MTTLTAILRQRNGDRPHLYYLYTRTAPDAAEPAAEDEDPLRRL